MILNIPHDIYQALPLDFFNALMHQEGECYRAQPGRKTLRVTLAGKDYFIKQHFGIGYFEMIKSALRVRLPVIGAQNEWQALAYCASLGINTAPLIGFGASGMNPAKQQSFVLTKPLENMQTLEEVFQKKIEHSLKRKIISELALLVKTFHQAGMCHRDMYLCHFLLAPHSLKLYMMDLHRVTIHSKIALRDQEKDLAALLYSSFTTQLNVRDIVYFLKIYTGQSFKQIKRDSTFTCIFKKACVVYKKDYGMPLWIPQNNIDKLNQPFASRIKPIILKLTAGDFIKVEALLRRILNKRWVVRASWHHQTVVAKIFSDEKKYQQELQGISNALKANIVIPQVLYQGYLKKENVYMIIFEFVQGEKPLIEDLINITNKLHEQGLMQTDLHIDNFIKTEKDIICLDAGDIKTLHNPQDNWALLFAQFETFDKTEHMRRVPSLRSEQSPSLRAQRSNPGLKAQSCTEPGLRSFARNDGELFSISNVIDVDSLIKKIDFYKQKRKNILSKKIFRNCSAITCWKGIGYKILMRNDAYTPQLLFFLRHIQNHHPDYVIERFTDWNICKKSAAAKRWQQTHLDELIGKHEVIPIAMVEQLGFFKKTSYFISKRTTQ